jgi:drug/metabolite transporter (DMT)-like permease
MSLAAAYLAVILIWSTTPLGIVWSSVSVSPSLALLLRMVIALILGFIWIKLANIRFPWHKPARKLYLNSGIGIAGGMFFTYLGAMSIPSGIISLIFGLSPILSGLFAQKILHQQAFSLSKKLALMLAFIGLAIVCADKIQFDNEHYLGFIFILIAVTLFSLSGVLVKSVNVNIHPVASTVGTLIYSMPVFIIGWLILDGNVAIPEWQSKSLLSILYLGVVGSLLGFVAYFYILKRLSASTVSLVTLMTPVIAIILGNQLNNETISNSLILGTALIIYGLSLFLFGKYLTLNFKTSHMK